MQNKIFIGGIPRSGTTMVQNILDSHSKIYGGSEFDRLPNIMELRTKLLNTLKAGRIEEYTNKEAIDKAIINLIDDLFKGIKTEKKIEYISEKTPWNILFFDELFEVFPDAKFVMVLRNPLNVYSSMKQVALNAKKKHFEAPDFTENYLLAIAYMEKVYDIMDRLKTKHPKSFYLIKYEDLLGNLELESKNLCDFIEINWEENLLNFNKIKHPGEKTMTQNDVWYTKEKFKANPEDKIKESVKLNLSIKEKVFISYMFRYNKLTKSYFSKLPLIYIILGKLINQKYKSKYRFKSIPKRVLN